MFRNKSRYTLALAQIQKYKYRKREIHMNWPEESQDILSALVQMQKYRNTNTGSRKYT